MQAVFLIIPLFYNSSRNYRPPQHITAEENTGKAILQLEIVHSQSNSCLEQHKMTTKHKPCSQCKSLISVPLDVPLLVREDI